MQSNEDDPAERLRSQLKHMMLLFGIEEFQELAKDRAVRRI